MNVEQFKKDSIRKSQSSMDRVVRNDSSRINSLDPINAYSFWNQSNTARFGYWGSSVARSSLHSKVSDRSDKEITRKIDHCIQCGCHPKPDQWAGETSRLCIDCGDR